MESETLTNSKVVGHVKDCFIPLKFDGDVDKRMARQLGVQSFPTTIIVSPSMKVIATIKGFRTANQLSGDLATLCSHREKVAPILSANPASNLAKPSVYGELCPVSRTHDGNLVQGRREYQMRFRGFELRFSSLESFHQFQSEPSRFWPIADGYCVVSALDHNIVKFGHLSHGLIYADRIWVFSSREHMQRFADRPHYYLQKLTELAGQQSPENLTDQPSVAARQS